MCILTTEKPTLISQIEKKHFISVLGKRGNSINTCNDNNKTPPLKKNCLDQKDIGYMLVSPNNNIPKRSKNNNKIEGNKVKITKKEEKAILDLISAARSGKLNKIKRLIEKHEDIIDKTHIGYSALHYAVFYNHMNVVEYLIENGANIDICSQNGVTPLAWGVDRGYINLVGYLLECEADPSISNGEGISPLHTAVRLKNYQMVETLLSINTETEEWTKVNSQTKLGYTCCYYAAFDGSLDILKLLFDYGADFNISSFVNVSPLHRAVNQGHIDTIIYLLDNGANINKKDNNGRTCLHSAVLSGNYNIIDILLKYNPLLQYDNANMSPLDLAKIRKKQKILEILEEYEATCLL